MTEVLVKLFIKDSGDLHNPRVRSLYGKLSGLVGIVCNIFLFAGKFFAGTISGSVSILADSFNNLSDASSSIISLLGFKMADKSADEEHPYGHARYEYLAGLIVAVMILVIGVELFKTSINKIIHPEAVEFSILSAGVLVVSILLKAWMTLFNGKIGKRINSATIQAAAADSRNDVITTGAVLVAACISHFTYIELDGWMGVAVAVFILYSGVGLIKETIDPILGKAPDPELVEYIQNKILSYPGVLGTHDLMVHDYGPCRQFASVHVEVAAEEDIIKSHDVIDNIERDFLNEDNLNMIVHMDPIVTSDSAVTEVRTTLIDLIKSIHPGLSIHDLRVVPGTTHTNLIFDCVKPHGIDISDTELTNKIKHRVSEISQEYICVITIDASYAAMPHEKS